MTKHFYGVTLPITGTVYIEVVADSEDEAIDAAMDAATNDDIETWQTHRQIVRGNVFYGEQNEADAQDLGDASENEGVTSDRG